MHRNTTHIDCFVPYLNKEQASLTIKSLQATGRVNAIYLLHHEPVPEAGHQVLITPAVHHSDTLKAIHRVLKTDCFLICFRNEPIDFESDSLQQMAERAADNSWIFSDYWAIENGQKTEAPLADHQSGSVRDDFDLGAVSLIRSDSLRQYLQESLLNMQEWQYSAWYALRMFVLAQGEGNICRLPQMLYTVMESDLRKSGEKQFDYVNPRNREVQLERERVFTLFLIQSKRFLLPGEYETVNLQEGDYPYEASVVIPVRNRARTIADAIESVLDQETDFPFNLLVVDNHSTDGTSEIIERYTHDARVKHIIPEATNLGIGGCWNRAIHDKDCGRFAVQLDSDDLYSSPSTLQKVVDKFYEENCAMVIGSYRMCNFQLETLPPGIIDHKEWTETNGRNNAIRINGLGAPRAFLTRIARQYPFPNVSYGEDYAMGLTISQHHRIGRIYDELYLCRRWEGNSDAALSREKVNINNHYKDSLRTTALSLRKTTKDNALAHGILEQLSQWKEACMHYMDLWFNVQSRTLT
ncbi:MAG: glycosyltransferase family 2 protein, partial [Bacteroidaceae bacterium]|nr:glycosyltransferase family 2 protein [Bacteroidaceae bacterium]